MLMQIRDFKQHSAVPHLSAIASSSDVGNMTSSISSDLNAKSSSFGGSVRKVHGSVYSHQDDSSSDEELREPMAESPPNLSDEDSAESFRTSPPPRVSNDNDDVISNDVIARRVITVARTSSHSNFLMTQRATNPSPTNPLYEAAKPRPPPRRTNEKRSAHVTCGNPVTGSDVETVTQASIVTLPYVSRGTSKVKLRRSSRSSSVTKDNCDVTIKENAPLETGGLLSTKISEESRVESTGSESPSRATASSSGYSSPGTGLSPSSSNASSNASSLACAPPRDQDHSDAPAARQRSDTQTSSEIKPDAVATATGSVGDSNPEDDDVFPITKWVESSEYKNLVSSPPNKSSGDDVTATPPTRLSDNSTSPVTSQERESRPRSAHVTSTRSRALTGLNSISMVEESTAVSSRTKKSPGAVMMRFPVGRSKKQAASRSSRAFALQATSQTDVAVAVVEDKRERRRSKCSSSSFDSSKESDVRRAASLSPKTFASEELSGCKRELSASLAHLERAPSPQKPYNTISGATGRHLSEQSTFYHDEFAKSNKNNNNSYYQSTHSVYDGSTWSLNPAVHTLERSHAERKPSLRHRLKGAFSFQNIRKAISMERLDEDERLKSVSHCYLNEYVEDISKVPASRSKPANTTESSNRLYKAPSITSILSTVRMRKRRSRERRAAKARNTIAVDPKQIPEYEIPSHDTKSLQRNNGDDVGKPGHFRPIGRVLQMDPRLGTLLIEMIKPPSGPFGFYLARRKGSGSVYISSMSDSYPDKMYAGLMKLGDEITEVNGSKVAALTLDQIYDLILESDRLLLRIKPTQVHSV